jgi:hypothetical protein
VTFAASADVLVALFFAESQPPLAVGSRDRGGSVFDDECVELFVALATDPGRYVEVVANPAGAVYTALVSNPDGSRRTWTVTPVEVPGVSARVLGSPGDAGPAGFRTWSCRLEVPWREVGTKPPAEGEERRANAFRIARGAAGTRHLALSPTFRADPPDFHVPSRFARLSFARLL